MSRKKIKGYHLAKIDRGVLGKSSKIVEEVQELLDAEAQGNRIMALCELSDIYGALEAYAEAQGFRMSDVKIMSQATKRAFLSGRRTSERHRSD